MGLFFVFLFSFYTCWSLKHASCICFIGCQNLIFFFLLVIYCSRLWFPWITNLLEFRKWAQVISNDGPICINAAGAFTWPNPTVWLERGLKHTLYSAELALWLILLLRNFRVLAMMIRCANGMHLPFLLRLSLLQ